MLGKYVNTGAWSTVRNASLGAVAFCMSAFTPALGENEPLDGLSIKDINHREHWSGTKLKSKTLKGKVVLLKIWGG